MAKIEVMSITRIMAKAEEANNKRLNSMSMTQSEMRVADKAVERGLMSMHFADFPGFGFVKMYKIKA